MEKKLQRIESDKMIAGVAAGLAEHLNVDPVLIRVAFVMAVLAGFSGILIYVILWIAMPVKPFTFPADYKATPYPNNNGSGYVVFGAVLIFLGMYFLLDELDIIPFWIMLHKLWPLAIIIPGIIILTQSMKKGTISDADNKTWDKREEDKDNKKDNEQTI